MALDNVAAQFGHPLLVPGSVWLPGGRLTRQPVQGFQFRRGVAGNFDGKDSVPLGEPVAPQALQATEYHGVRLTARSLHADLKGALVEQRQPRHVPVVQVWLAKKTIGVDHEIHSMQIEAGRVGWQEGLLMPRQISAAPLLVAHTTNWPRSQMTAIQVTAHIVIAESELEEHFVQASGPGGQNVNKVATAVQLRFDVARSPSLPQDVRYRLLALCGRRLTQDGVLVLIARRHRTQERNRADARARLVELIREAAVPPKPRRPTRPTLASKRRRLEAKSARSNLKRERSKPSDG